MCGLAGIISAELDHRARADAVARMVNRQQHRGPDDRGFHHQGPATLGMCRLAIIDPTHGHQPMFSPDERFSLIFNGTIYNHHALRAGLAARGWIFRTQCDTEVLLAAYALDGAACLRTLRGMFAFAIWDAREQILFAARDSFGIKPLYYAQLPSGGLAFASELNALLASGQVTREIDPLSVSEYLAWFSVPAPRTIYRGITNLPPGHWLKVNAEGRCQTAAWDQLPSPSGSAPIATNYHDFVHGLRYQLDDTIRAHRVAAERPWFGWGLESYAHVFRIFNTQRAAEAWIWITFYAEAHNDWLQSLAEVGFVGTALLGLLLALPLWRVQWRHVQSLVPRYLLTGNSIILLYAWLEFPFANPAVVLTFFAIFYTALRYAQQEALQRAADSP